MKRNDFFIIIIGLLLAATAWFTFNRAEKPVRGAKVIIYKDGAIYGSYPLDRDETISIKGEEKGFNVVQIKDGNARMIEADCNDKICVNTRPARKDGQSVVCLPNRVVVEIRSIEQDDIDGVSE